MTQRITCDNEAARAGWVEYFATLPYGEDMHVSVAPDADLDGVVRAFWHDEQRMVTLHGWLATFEPVEKAAPVGWRFIEV